MSIVNSDQPLISVVMPVYNAECFVSTAIESILLQTYSLLEVIVVDDGSEDGSRAIIEAVAQRDARVHLLAVEHGGTSVALNVGIAAARGDYIALMDADDVALPERLAIQLEYLQRTGAEVCGACAQSFASVGKDQDFSSENKVLWFPESHLALRSELLFRCALLPSAVLMRTDIARAHPYLQGVVFQDYEMWTRLAPHYRLANCPQILVRYRRHPQQISRRLKTQNQKDMNLYRRRYFFALFPETKPTEFEAFERLALQEAHVTLADLETAGAWLLRLSDVGDGLTRKRMAERWLGACGRSAGLGMPCFDLYRKMAQEFGNTDPRAVQKLRFRCLLRLGLGSRTDQLLKQLRSKFVFRHLLPFSARNWNEDHAIA